MESAQSSILVGFTGKIALVTLIESSNHGRLSADDLALQIRRKIESSILLEAWTVERVAVLDADTSTEKAKKVAIA